MSSTSPPAYSLHSIDQKRDIASNPIPPSNTDAPEKPLTCEEWWDLLWSLEGA